MRRKGRDRDGMKRDMLKSLRDIRNPLAPTRLFSLISVQAAIGRGLLDELIESGNVEIRPHRTSKRGKEVWLVDDRL